MSDRDSALEKILADIRAAPEAPQGYLVYADWLQSEPADPRGALIMTQHELQKASGKARQNLEREEARLFRAHAEHLLYPPSPGVQKEWFDQEQVIELEWENGFAKRAVVRPPRFSSNAETLLEALLKHPTGAFVRSLEIEPQIPEEKFELPPLQKVLLQADPKPPLRALTVRLQEVVQDNRFRLPALPSFARDEDQDILKLMELAKDLSQMEQDSDPDFQALKQLLMGIKPQMEAILPKIAQGDFESAQALFEGDEVQEALHAYTEFAQKRARSLAPVFRRYPALESLRVEAQDLFWSPLQLPALRTLHLEGKVPLEALRDSQLPNLEQLTLALDNERGDWSALGALFSKTPKLKRFKLSSPRSADAFVHDCAQALSPSLEVLDLSGGGLSELGIDDLLAGIRRCPNLQKLELKENRLTKKSKKRFEKLASQAGSIEVRFGLRKR